MYPKWTIAKITFAALFLSMPQSLLAQSFPVFDSNLRIGIEDRAKRAS